MRVPAYKRVTRQELGFFAPEWIDRALSPIQDQLEIMTNALRGNLTRSDNLSGETQLVTMEDSVEKNVKVTARPQAVYPGWVEDGNTVDEFAWRVVNDSKIAVTIVYGAPKPSSGVKVRLVME